MKGGQFDSRSVALGGILAAGSLALLWVAVLLPAGRMGFAALAGLFPVVGVLAAGRTVGLLCWAAAGILSLILLPDKGVALMYFLFLGLYPVVKSWIEALGRLGPEWALKAACFNVVFLLFWFGLRGLVFPEPPEWMTDHLWLAVVAGNGVFVVYDRLLTQVIALLQERIFFR